MIRLLKGLNAVVIVAIVLLSIITIIGIVPWYSQQNPMVIMNNDKPFKPGSSMFVTFKRRALIGFQGSVTRELVRINESTGAIEEIWKSSLSASIGKGDKTIVLAYKIPSLAMYPEMRNNTYKWQGSMVYKPFGMIEKTFFFETEEFQIDVEAASNS